MAYECIKCMYSEKDISEWPCNECLEILHTRFEKKDTVVHKDNSPSFLPYMMREEEFKIPDSIQIMIDQNKKPNLVIPQLDDIKKKIDELSESLESVNSKLNILDQRMHDFGQHQILKDMKCVTQVKEVEKDISRLLSKVDMLDCLVKDSKDEEESKKDISERPEPKFQVGDIVKVAHDTKHKDFFVCKIKWSEHSKIWNYLISLDLEDISGAFWRMEGFLTKSEDYIEPLFKVGDKVKLKHGKTVYEVYSITYFMHNKNKVYRYKIGHKATTPHYENENRLIKA